MIEIFMFIMLPTVIIARHRVKLRALDIAAVDYTAVLCIILYVDAAMGALL